MWNTDGEWPRALDTAKHARAADCIGQSMSHFHSSNELMVKRNLDDDSMISFKKVQCYERYIYIQRKCPVSISQINDENEMDFQHAFLIYQLNSFRTLH